MKKLLSIVIVLLCVLPALAGGDVLVNAGHEGQPFDYLPKLVRGKINIIDFYSPYCPPCRRIMPLLGKLTEADKDVVVLRLDINRPEAKEIDFESPLAQQYQLQSVPNFRVYDKNGTLLKSGDDAYGYVIDLLKKYKIVS